MKCSNPDVCSAKAAAHQEKQEKFLSKAQILLEEFQEILMRGVSSYVHKGHSLRREYERCFSKPDIEKAMMDGWVIEAQYQKQFCVWHILLMSHIKYGPKAYRPIHLACMVNEESPDNWEIKTVYDPRTMPWKWNDGYSTRVCFCIE